jgi:hypothetical protein
VPLEPRTMVNVVVLSATGESRTLKTTAIGPTGASGAAVAKALRRKAAAERIGTYTWKGRTLVLWGWSEGKAGTENKHELPPPHDELLLFGDAIVVAEGGDLTVEEWTVFYDAAFGGFEDLDSENEEEDESDEEDEDDDDESGGADDGEDGEVEEEDDDADESDESSDDDDGDAGDDDEEEEEEEEEDGDDDCYDDGEDGGGGGKRRAPRRRTVATPDCRRIDMGLRSRIKIPTPVGKRAPRWQTAPELEEEGYDA